MERHGEIVVHVDGDVLFFGSLDTPVDMLENADCDAVYLPTWMRFKHHIRHRAVAEERLKVSSFDGLDEKSTLGGVFFALRATPATERVYKYASEQWHMLRPLLYTEESILLYSHVRNDVKYALLDWSYGWPLQVYSYGSKDYVVPAEIPLTPDTGDPIVIAHFANVKWDFLSSGGPANHMWYAWQRIAEKYKSLPWEAAA
jgi:hypothetical protein